MRSPLTQPLPLSGERSKSRLARFLVSLALAAASLAAGALALDRIFPPDLSRYHDRSTEIVDSNGRLLRAFTTADGKWRLRTTVDEVDPSSNRLINVAFAVLLVASVVLAFL